MKLDELKKQIGDAGLKAFDPNDGGIIPSACFWIFGCTSTCESGCSSSCTPGCSDACSNSDTKK